MIDECGKVINETSKGQEEMCNNVETGLTSIEMS